MFKGKKRDKFKNQRLITGKTEVVGGPRVRWAILSPAVQRGDAGEF